MMTYRAHALARRLPHLAIAASFALAACEPPTDPARHVNMHSTADVYVAQPGGGSSFEVTVVIRLENTSRRPLELDRCTPSASTPLFFVGSTQAAESAYNGAWGCPASPPLVVAPGEVREDTLRLVGPAIIRHDGAASGALSGPMFIGYVRGNRRYQSNVFAVELPTR